MITGNLQDNFNKIEIFFDTTNAISTNVYTGAGNDASGNMNGMKFDTDFAPDYHVILRRGFRFDLDISNLSTAAFDSYLDVLNGSGVGSGFTGTGTVNSAPIAVGHNDSNTAGIIDENGGTLADQTAALAVNTGIEFCISLADIGAPSGSMKVMILLNNDQHNFVSNQSLPGMPEGTGNLGDPTTSDFSALAGDQFFTLALPADPAGLGIELVSYDGTNLVINVTGTEVGKAYQIKSSTDLVGFSSTGVSFNSTSASGISIPANSSAVGKQFFRAEEVIALD